MINDIRLQQFRSYRDASFELGPGVNIIVGPNGSGKTNLLEALLVVGIGRSYRVRDSELVQFDRDWARVAAHTADEERIIRLEKTAPAKATKRYTINKQPLTRLPLTKTLPVVLFEPEHLQLLSGGPELRREFIDDLLEQTVSGYGRLRRDYRRALAQRNALLKTDPQADSAQLFAWNVRLSELGAQIVQQRQQLITRFNERLTPLYRKLSRNKATVALEYQATSVLENYGSGLLEKLETNTILDTGRGFTAYGPHREDVLVWLNRHPAQQTASRGEARTLLMALKMLELTMVEESRGKRPLLLLDDVFSELDGARRRALTAFVKNYQTFITTTDADIVVQHFMGEGTVIPLKK